MKTPSTSVKSQVKLPRLAAATLIWLPLAVGAYAQDASSDAVRAGSGSVAASAPVVPQQVRYAGKMASRAGETVETEFRIYAAPEGGEALWTETQQVPVGLDGAYAVLLGGASPAGLPQRVFAGGAARWLGVSIGGGQEAERILLSSVPYAMKSADAESLGGHTAAEFVTQAQLAAVAAQTQQTAAEVAAGKISQGANQTSAQPEFQPLANGALTGSGTSGAIPVWNGQYTEGNSNMVQVGSDIGINVVTPASTLDVGGGTTVRGTLALPATATATTAGGHNSQWLESSASTWSTTAAAAVAQNFGLEVTPVGNNTAAPTGSLALFYSAGANPLAATGFSIASNGRLTFAAGQTFPGVLLSVAGTSPITATTSAGAVTVGLNTAALETTLNAVYPTLTASNVFHSTQTINGGLTVSSTINGAYEILSGALTAQAGVVSNNLVTMRTAGVATAATSYPSPQFYFDASAYSSTLAAAQTQNFVMQEFVTGNNTATPGGYLAVEFSQGAVSPKATGLQIASNGVITFAPSQTFPITGTGGGTITSVGTTSPLTGAATSGAVTIGLNTATLGTTLESTYDARYARLSGGNIFTSYLDANQTAGPGNAALLGWGSSGSVGAFGDSDSGYGVQGESTSGQGVYGQVTTPVPGSEGVLGSTGNTFSVTYSSEAGIADAGVWSDISTGGTGIPVSLFATADDAYGLVAITNSPDYPSLYADNNNGTAAEFQATSGFGLSASTSSGTGVYGSTEGSGNGVEGWSTGTTSQNAGVLGVADETSGTYGSYNIYAGVQGDTGTSSTAIAPEWAIGVLGTADDSHAGVFLNDSASWSTMYVSNADTGGTGLFKAMMVKSADGTCGIGSGGSLSCTGQIKSLVSAGGGARTVETYAVQSPENWMEDFGSGQLRQGVAVITIEAAFAETVTADSSYHVFLTPNGDSKGLYVIAKTPTTFEVRESGGGTSSLSFDYRIVAKRRGFEAQRLVDVTERFNSEMKASAMFRSTGPKHTPKALARSPLQLAPGVHPRVMAPHRMNREQRPAARPVSATASRP